MIGPVWRWLAGSRVGRALAAAGALIAGAVWLRIDAYRDGKRDKERQHEEADRERADGVRHRADAARRNAADGGSDADKRLRDHGRFRD